VVVAKKKKKEKKKKKSKWIRIKKENVIMDCRRGNCHFKKVKQLKKTNVIVTD
jgi:hypothetical protein